MIEKQKRLLKLLGVKETDYKQVVIRHTRSAALNVAPRFKVETDHDGQIVSEHDMQAEHIEAEEEDNNTYFDVTEPYDETHDESQIYFVAVSENEQEQLPEEDENDATVDQIEEDEQIVDENYEMSAEFVESDEEYVVYEEDITADEADKSKRKYTKRGNPDDKQYRCWFKGCGSTFSFRAPMRKHMQQIHGVVCDKNTCFMCGDRYDNSADFLAHVKIHTRKFECDVCKLSFINEDAVLKHKKKFHSKKEDDVRNFKCAICGARFKRKEHLASHQVYKHSDKSERKHHCDQCSSSFLTRQDLKNHIKSHEQYKIKCVYCPYDCRDLKSMRRHCLKLHETVQIYRCDCQETYEIFREMQAHKKTCSVAQNTTHDESMMNDESVSIK